MASGKGGGSAGKKFVIRFEVEGNGEKQLKNIAKTLGTVGDALTKGNLAKGSAAVGKNMNGLNRKLANTSVAANTSISAMHHLSQTVTNVGEGLIGFSSLVRDAFIGFGSMILMELAPIETAMIRIQTMGELTKEQTLKTIDMAQDIVVFTPFLERHVVGMTAALASAKVPMDFLEKSLGKTLTLADATAQGLTRMDEATLSMAGSMRVSATSLIADFAAMSGNVGERAESFVRGINRALAVGNVRMLVDQVDPKDLLSIFGTTGKMTISAEEAMENMYDHLAKKQGIGTAALASNTMDGIMSNFHDIPLLIAKAIGGMPGTGGFFDQMKNGLAGIFSTILEGLNSKEMQNAIKEGLTPVVEMFLRLMEVSKHLIKWVSEFVKANPQVLTFVAALMGLAAAAALAGGVILVLIGGFVAMQVAMSFLPVQIAVIAAGLGAVAAAFGFMSMKGDSVMQKFQNWRTIISGVIEALKNWNGETTTISRDTAVALEDAGLLEIFLSFIRTIRRLEHVGKAMWKGMKEAWEWFTTTFGPLLDDIGDSFSELGKEFMFFLRLLGLVPMAGEGLQESKTVSEEWGEYMKTFSQVVLGIAAVFLMQLGFVMNIVVWFVKLVNRIQLVFQYSVLIARVWGTGFLAAVVVISNLVSGMRDSISAMVQTLVALSSGDFASAADAWKEAGSSWSTAFSPSQDEDLAAFIAGNQKLRGEIDESHQMIKSLEEGRIASTESPALSGELMQTLPSEQQAAVSMQERLSALQSTMDSLGKRPVVVQAKITNQTMLDGDQVAETVNQKNMSTMESSMDQGGY